MAASVNNVAATFATVPLSSSTLSSSSTSPPSKQSNFPLSSPHTNKPISISWNPHSSIPKSHRSSFLAVYGPPGPPPHSIPVIPKSRPPPSQLIGQRLPNATVRYLDRSGKIQGVNVSSLAKGKKVSLVGVASAFSAKCEEYVRNVATARLRAVDLIACVAVNDVVVMRAWGRILNLGEKTMMVSDLSGDLCRRLGVVSECRGLGLGIRSRRFCLSAVDGVIVNFNVDEDDGVEEEIDLVSQKIKDL